MRKLTIKLNAKPIKKVNRRKVALNKLGVENSLYNNIRKKAELNKKKGLTPKKPTKDMLKQDKLIAKNTKKK